MNYPQQQAYGPEAIKQYLWDRAKLLLHFGLPMAAIAGSIFFMEKHRHLVLQQAINYSALAMLSMLALFVVRLFLYSPTVIHYLQNPMLMVVALLRGAAIYMGLLWAVGRYGDQAYYWIIQNPVNAVALFIAMAMAYLSARISHLI
jgi:hypothetical protein